ncbi:MAG TPA: phosphomannomutase/phosphoglucomutase [Coxiellaceae bacterium]|nr:MAG: phosphoglucomutase [Gammaproteobacteria bacterium RBG_16_37_9]HBC72111.1 phosphomannomutase/phosphoglucomutase [Coxiellaceae bacterium]
MVDYKIVDSISEEIFRAYDIRGIVPETFNKDNIYTIGVAIGSEALSRGQNTVAVGRDGRISGPELLQALIAGILATGCNIVNIDEVTTPILYYAAAIMESHSGVMLSGSHNPPNYNGIKIVIGGETLYGEAIQKLHNRIVKKDFKFGSGKASQIEIIDDYLQRVTGDVKLARPLKVIIDCGNGVGGLVAPKLFRMLGCEVTELYCEVDGNFPHHQPDPSVPKNLEELVELVKAKKADVGLAFDGDADRVGVVTEKGEIIAADRLLMLFAIDFLTRHPGMTITFDVKCTKHLAEQITKHGGVPLMYKTGHSLIKSKMQELGALLAGELSGHMFIKERWFGFDDGIYVAARFLEMLTKDKKSCSEVFAQLPDSINTPELKVQIAESQKFAFIEKLIKEAKFPGGKIITIDGLRVDYDNGFGLIRASNTTPYLTMRFEGDTKADLEKIQNIFKEQLLKLDPKLQLPI